MYGCESWNIKMAECWRIDAFNLWCWRLFESPLKSRAIKPVNLKRNSTLNIHWQDWYWSWSSNTLATWCKQLTHWKRPWCWERLKTEGKEQQRMRWLDGIKDGHAIGQTLGDDVVWRSLTCCSPWGHEESNTIWQLNKNNLGYWWLLESLTVYSPGEVRTRKNTLW